MDILAKLERLVNIGKGTRELQQQINVLEVSNIWISIESRYRVLEETKIFLNNAKDADLKIIIELGINRLERQVKMLEDIMAKYAIPSSKRPPAVLNEAAKSQVITDEYIFRRIFSGIRAFLSIHLESFAETPSLSLREMFKDFLIEEADIYDRMFEYGKIKGWVDHPPDFRL